MTSSRPFVPFAVVDSFTDRPFTGNPAAVVVVDGLIVTSRSDVPDADYLLRYFAPRAGALTVTLHVSLPA